jgi:hypothetical protein
MKTMKKFLMAIAVAAATTMAAPVDAGTIFMGTTSGNDSLAEINAVIAGYNTANGTSYDPMQFWLAKWNCVEVGASKCGTWDKENKAVAADLFDVEMGADAKTGAFTYEGSDGHHLGAYVVKGGNGFALYYLDPALASVDAPGMAFDTFSLVVGNGKKAVANNPALSHISWYGVEGDEPTCEQGGDCDSSDVPEPASLALLGIGLLGAGYAHRRKQ